MGFINKTYRFKLKLTDSQRRRVDDWINVCRAVYNLSLETRIYAYNAHKVSLSTFDLIKQLSPLRKEFDWIKDVSAETLQSVIERQESAYRTFFKGGGFPKWAKKDKYNSIVFKNVAIHTHNRVKLPKIGSVKYFASQEIKGELRRATIVKDKIGDYYISILTKQERKTIFRNHDSQVGIDMGVAFFASLSTGRQIENPRHFLKYQKQLRVEQRSLSRKTKNSKNREKQKLRVAKLHRKIKNVRRDFVQKQSSCIVRDFSVVGIENLEIKNMSQYGFMGKHICDVGWGMFFECLEYKTDWYGGILEGVDPKYTSQTCNLCGEVDRMSRVSQSRFVCTSCGTEQNADINAAKNILDRALSNLREREALVCA